MITHFVKPMTVAVAGIVVLLTSCQSAPTRLFALNPVAPASIPGPYHGPAIRVEVVHVPPALDRIEISSEVAPGEFRVNELDHWVAPLTQITRQVLTADLMARLPQGRVIFPHLAGPAGAIGINVDLLSFRADREGVATLHVSWVGIADASQPRCEGTMVLQTTQAGVTPAATANALSTLLAQLADRIVAELSLLTPVDGDAAARALLEDVHAQPQSIQ
jgi:uncharacterized lipoprotein YmbA